jgi:adenine C2-methylase RlmN of 23S rRNA A2503 and tRNA A37
MPLPSSWTLISTSFSEPEEPTIAPIIAIKTKSKITYEYVVWKGINDTEEHAHALLRFCKLVPSKVNLIEYNPIDDGEFKQASDHVLTMYMDLLERNGIAVQILGTGTRVYRQSPVPGTQKDSNSKISIQVR